MNLMSFQTPLSALQPVSGPEYYERLTASLRAEAEAALAQGRPDLHAQLMVRAEAMAADAQRLFDVAPGGAPDRRADA